MAVLDPNESERRKSCIKVAIRALRDMVLKLPMVSNSFAQCEYLVCRPQMSSLTAGLASLYVGPLSSSHSEVGHWIPHRRGADLRHQGTNCIHTAAECGTELKYRFKRFALDPLMHGTGGETLGHS